MIPSMFDGPCLRKLTWFKQGLFGGFDCRDLRKSIPLVKRKWNLFILYDWLKLGLIQSTIKHYKSSLLCSLNPGISPYLNLFIFILVCYLSQNFDQSIFSPLPQSLVLIFKLELSRTKSLDDNPIPLYYSGVRVL